MWCIRANAVTRRADSGARSPCIVDASEQLFLCYSTISHGSGDEAGLASPEKALGVELQSLGARVFLRAESPAAGSRRCCA